MLTHREIVGKVIAADRDGGCVHYRAFKVDDQLGRAGADVDQAATQFAFVGAQGAFRRSQRLVHGFRDRKASLVRAGHQTLVGGSRAGGQVERNLQLMADHADRVMDAGHVVEQEVARQQVQDFPVAGERDGPCPIGGGAHVFAGNLAHFRAERVASLRVDAAQVGSANACDALFDHCFRGCLGHDGSLADGGNYRFKLGDDAAPDTRGRDLAMSAVAQRAVVHLSHHHAGARAAHIEHRQYRVRFRRQGVRPPLPALGI